MTGRPGEAPLDGWSVVHAACGVALGLVVRHPVAAVALVVGYEVFEAALRRVKRHGKGLFEYESWPNIGYDVAFGMLGWLLGRAMPAVGAWPW